MFNKEILRNVSYTSLLIWLSKKTTYTTFIILLLNLKFVKDFQTRLRQIETDNITFCILLLFNKVLKWPLLLTIFESLLHPEAD